jgi:glycosyltransferase involved in cell wall biosynthesis
VSGELPESPLVSVIISNYNYGHFLREAIDSALNQTYPRTEIIVVDDGSTDSSREVIADYEHRVVPVLKDNGGQASACNVGFTMSKGEIAIFLDADDVLLPDITRSVVAAFRTEPSTVMAQYRMQSTDARGKTTGELIPPSWVPMPSGDLRRHILKFHSYTWPGTSGSAFASTILRRILPMPEALYRGTPDIYLCNLSPVFGPIVSLDQVGALHRIHGKNTYYSTTLDVARVRRTVLAVADSHVKQRHLFRTLYAAEVQELGSRDHYFLVYRAISLKLDPLNHPFRESLLSLCVRGCKLCITTSDPTLRRGRAVRLMWALWFTAMLFAPKAIARSFAGKALIPEKRGLLHRRLVPLLRKIQ